MIFCLCRSLAVMAAEVYRTCRTPLSPSSHWLEEEFMLIVWVGKRKNRYVFILFTLLVIIYWVPFAMKMDISHQDILTISLSDPGQVFLQILYPFPLFSQKQFRNYIIYGYCIRVLATQKPSIPESTCQMVDKSHNFVCRT